MSTHADPKADAGSPLREDAPVDGARFDPDPQSAPLLEVVDLVRHYTLPRERLFGPSPVVKALNM